MRTANERISLLASSLKGVFLGHAGVRCALVFGSIARGTARPESDLDIAIVAQDQVDLLQLTAELSQVAEQEVHLVLLDQPGVPLLEELMRDAQVIYEAIPGVFARWQSKMLCDLELDRPWFERMQKAWLGQVAQQGFTKKKPQ